MAARAPSIRLIRLLLAAVAMLALGACSSPLPSTELPPARFVSMTPEFQGLRDYRGVMNLSINSSGMDQSAIAKLAQAAQLDFIFIGDRVKPGDSDFGIGGFTDQLLFIAGGAFEVGGGQILGVNLRTPVRTNLTPVDLIGAIHDQDGLAVAAALSKFENPADYALADAIEVYNQRSQWLSESAWSRYVRAIFSSTDRFLASLDVRPDANLAAYDRMAAGARVTLVAGFGDADNMSVMGTHVGTLEQLFLFSTTHLIAREREIGPLVEALKLGHSYVSFDFLGYVGAFTFFAQTADTKILMGDEVPLASVVKLTAELPAPADRIVLLRNGEQVASASNATRLEFAPKTNGAYRVEAYRGDHMWILSNPLYVR